MPLPTEANQPPPLLGLSEPSRLLRTPPQPLPILTPLGICNYNGKGKSLLTSYIVLSWPIVGTTICWYTALKCPGGPQWPRATAITQGSHKFSNVLLQSLNGGLHRRKALTNSVWDFNGFQALQVGCSAITVWYSGPYNMGVKFYLLNYSICVWDYQGVEGSQGGRRGSWRVVGGCGGS